MSVEHERLKEILAEAAARETPAARAAYLDAAASLDVAASDALRSAGHSLRPALAYRGRMDSANAASNTSRTTLACRERGRH